jgi:hypothetical protein
VAAALIALAGAGCNAILGINNNHSLASGGTGGAAGSGGVTGSGGAAGTYGVGGGPACRDDEDGSVPDADGADAAPATVCGFLMPNPADAPGDLPNRARYSRDEGAKTVTDLVTGLVWEAEVDPTSVHTQDDAIRHCQNKPGGGWRLPSRIELVSLLDFTVPKPGPTISNVFMTDPVWSGADDGTGNYRKFWTSSHVAPDAGTGAWEVDFSDGSVHPPDTGGQFRARCVSGSACRCTSRHYQPQGSSPNEEIYDGITGLSWQRTFSSGKMVWVDATTYCPPGWRLPTPNELETIVDETTQLPAIDSVAFPGTPSQPFWTSAPQAGAVDGGTPTFAWYVNFFHGHMDVLPSNDTANNDWWVRCVRSTGP